MIRFGSSKGKVCLCLIKYYVMNTYGEVEVCRGADKSLAFLIFYSHIFSTTKGFFLNGLKKLEQRSHKCMELRGEYVE
jgi:hypothetical protein